MPRVSVVPKELTDAMREAGIPVDLCRRVVIDIQVNEVPIVYIEQYGDQTVLNIVRALSGVKIERG